MIFAQGETHLIKWSGLRAACESCALPDAAVVNGAFPGVWFLSLASAISGTQGVLSFIAQGMY